MFNLAGLASLISLLIVVLISLLIVILEQREMAATRNRVQIES